MLSAMQMATNGSPVLAAGALCVLAELARRRDPDERANYLVAIREVVQGVYHATAHDRVRKVAAEIIRTLPAP